MPIATNQRAGGRPQPGQVRRRRRRCRPTCCSSAWANSSAPPPWPTAPNWASSPPRAAPRRPRSRSMRRRRSCGEYNRYFGVHYPLPKLDNIAAPGRSQFFGAMENWGAIFTFEYAMLLDPAISTQSDKQQVFATAAHEMAHQWFGDLVTMQWWDDLWLNEGFASWMESRMTARLHPGMEHRAGRGRRARERDGARFGRHHPPGGAACGNGRTGQPGVRRHHLPEGRVGDPHAGELRRRRRPGATACARTCASTPTTIPSRTTCGARSRAAAGKPVTGHRARLHAAAGRAADPRRRRRLQRQQHQHRADARRSSAATSRTRSRCAGACRSRCRRPVRATRCARWSPAARPA